MSRRYALGVGKRRAADQAEPSGSVLAYDDNEIAQPVRKAFVDSVVALAMAPGFMSRVAFPSGNTTNNPACATSD